MPHQKLAKAVIAQALRDALDPQDSAIRSEARSFLRASSPTWGQSFHDWCMIADICASKLSNKVKEWDKKGWPTIKKLKEDHLQI